MAETFDAIIVGGGPAGLAAAVYTGRGELTTLILERGQLGGQVAMTHKIDNYPGFPDGIDGPRLTELMREHGERFGATIRTEDVLEMKTEGLWKTVRTRENAYRAATVILAMGADPRKLGVPGEDELRGRGVSYCGTCDAPFFRDKKVVVVGGGDTALKEALYLTRFAGEVVIVHRRREFRAEKIYVTDAEKNPKVSFELDAVLDRINGEDKVASAAVRNVKSGETKEIACDGVFIFVGTQPNTKFLEGMCAVDAAGHLETDLDMMTCEPGVFAVGDVRKNSYRQVATAVGEGVTAAMAAEHWISKMRAEGKLD